MHFAAQSHVDVSLKNSLIFTEVNVLGTHVLLECSRLVNLKRFIHVSTDEVYGTTEEKASDQQKIDPTNPYACSKLAAEFIIMAYQKCYKLPVIITRGNNVYGPNQFFEKVIPKFIVRLLKGRKCCVHHDGTAIRDFLYISDVVDAFEKMLHDAKINEFYNIGAEKGIRIIDLARLLIKLMKKEGKDEDFIEFVTGRVIEDRRYTIDSKAINELRWKQKIDFEEGLKMTIEWYKKNLDFWPDQDDALDLNSKHHLGDAR